MKSNFLKILNKSYIIDERTNLTSSIIQKLGMGIYLRDSGPISRLKSHIQSFFKSITISHNQLYGKNEFDGFMWFDHDNPIVTAKQNFDDLLFSSDHVARSSSDSFFINSEYMLRTHMTSNEREILENHNFKKFLICGDVYRRDEIDSTHYPVFHQIEGVKIFKSEDFSRKLLYTNFTNSLPSLGYQREHKSEEAEIVINDLKLTLTNLMHNIFGNDITLRWRHCFFPFTYPSLELEIFHRNKWIEICGCGILRNEFLHKCNRKNSIGWAFGIGVERIAMILYDIPDIRYFWTEDQRFIDQFSFEICNPKFKPYSKYPSISRDISFWIQGNSFEEPDFLQTIRDHAGELVEKVELIDAYFDQKNDRRSLCYRITYRALDRTLSDDEINDIQQKIREISSANKNLLLR